MGHKFTEPKCIPTGESMLIALAPNHTVTARLSTSGMVLLRSATYCHRPTKLQLLKYVRRPTVAYSLGTVIWDSMWNKNKQTELAQFGGEQIRDPWHLTWVEMPSRSQNVSRLCIIFFGDLVY